LEHSRAAQQDKMLTSSFRKKPQKFKRRKNERKGVKTKPVTNSSIKAKTIFFHKDKSKTLVQVKITFSFLLKSFFKGWIGLHTYS
jgi:hypothetical protein